MTRHKKQLFAKYSSVFVLFHVNGIQSYKKFQLLSSEMFGLQGEDPSGTELSSLHLSLDVDVWSFKDMLCANWCSVFEQLRVNS